MGQFPPPGLAPGGDRCSSDSGRYGAVVMDSIPATAVTFALAAVLALTVAVIALPLAAGFIAVHGRAAAPTDVLPSTGPVCSRSATRAPLDRKCAARSVDLPSGKDDAGDHGFARRLLDDQTDAGLRA
jgi:hypothetical protein